MPSRVLVGFALWLAAEAEAVEIVDRIVAVVDRDVITLSEAERALKLGILKGGTEPLSLAEAVDRLVELRLVEREVERYPAPAIGREKIGAALAAVRSTFDSEESFARALAQAEMSQSELEAELRSQLAVNDYLERRFRLVIQVGEAEIRRYYQEELLPELGRMGQPEPPLEAVSDAIRRILEERQFNSQVAAWIDQLKARANVRRYVW
jgi:hypothetical protein